MSGAREELKRLIQEISDDQVPMVLADVRRHRRPVKDHRWPPTFFGVAAGDGTAVGASADELLAEGFGRYM